jgi:hypothetical protein
MACLPAHLVRRVAAIAAVSGPTAARAARQRARRSRSSLERRATPNPWCFSLTAKWEIPAPSFGQVTGFWHIKFGNAFSFNEYVFSFLSITLRPHQFVVKPRCVGSWSRQWKCVCDFSPFVLGYLSDLRGRIEPPLRLFTILRLLKLLLQTLRGDFSGDSFVTRINHASRKKTRNNSHYCKTTHLRRNLEPEFLRTVNHHLHQLPA